MGINWTEPYLTSPSPTSQVSDVVFSDASTQTEDPEGLICTLQDNAGHLVKARAEAMLILLDALIGEEEMLSKEAGGESNLREYVYSMRGSPQHFRDCQSFPGQILRGNHPVPSCIVYNAPYFNRGAGNIWNVPTRPPGSSLKPSDDVCVVSH